MIPLWPDTLSDEFDALASIVMRMAKIPHDAAIVIAELILGRSRRRLILRRPPPLVIGWEGRDHDHGQDGTSNHYYVPGGGRRGFFKSPWWY